MYWRQLYGSSDGSLSVVFDSYYYYYYLFSGFRLPRDFEVLWSFYSSPNRGIVQLSESIAGDAEADARPRILVTVFLSSGDLVNRFCGG